MSQIVTYVEIDTPAFEVTSPMGPGVTWRFAEATEGRNRAIDCIPSISSVRYDAATISLGENLGQRASISVTFQDHPHIMSGEPFTSGTFWGKWRARYGQRLRGRALRLIRGTPDQALADMETRHFFVEAVDGTTPQGVYTVVAKDLLKFADDDRALAPRPSNGRLAGSIDDNDAAIVLSPTGIGDFEYPASGLLNLGGKEIVAFTRTGDAVSITRAQLGTSPQAHNAGDRAQLVLWYDGDDVADVVADLFMTYAGMPAECIPLADWQAETAEKLGVLYAKPIPEPTPVKKLVDELISNAALAVWYDELARLVRLRVLSEIATDAAVIDERDILEGSFRVQDQPLKRLSQVWTYFGLRNAADRGAAEDNFRAALATVDLVRETEYGGSSIRTVMGGWLPTLASAQRHNGIQLSRFRDPPRRFVFDLPGGRNGFAIVPGGGYRLVWRQNQNVDGSIVAEGAPIQITKVSVDAGVVHVEAEEMLASGTIVVTNVVFLLDTSGPLSWEVPDDWNDADNAVHVIGGGGSGGAAAFDGGGCGGSGAAYSSVANVSLTPASLMPYRVGAGGTPSAGNGSAGGDSWFGHATYASAIVAAKGGLGGPQMPRAEVPGGQASEGIGDVRTSGGRGGRGAFAGSERAGGGGAGAAGGPNGDGAPGASISSSSSDGGAGGGGADDGSASAGYDNTAGGNGGNNRFNFGGGREGQPHGLEGGGGKGGRSNSANTTGNGGAGEQMWTQTIAPIVAAGPGGGGGGGGSNVDDGGNGGLYGGGGGGGGLLRQGGAGGQGIIVIIWRPAA